MQHTLSRMFLIPLIGFASILATRSASAQITDNAGFFSPDAVQKANQAIDRMRRDTGREMVVETFPTIPDERKPSYQPQDRQAFMQRWAAERFGTNHVNGVYMLICREPSSLFITSGSQTREKQFTQADDDRLRDVMLPPMKDKQYDQALMKGVEFVDQTLRNRQGQSSQAPQAPAQNNSQSSSSDGESTIPPVSSRTPSSGTGIGFGTIIILAIIAFVVISVLRRIIAARQSYPPGSNYGSNPNAPAGYGNYSSSGGGGGFGRGILGGVLGGMAGGWLQNRMTRQNYDYGNTGGPSQLPRTNTYGSESNTSFPESTPDSSASGGSFGDFGGGGGESGGGGGGDSGSSGGSGGEF